jgi:hypothetical protein
VLVLGQEKHFFLLPKSTSRQGVQAKLHRGFFTSWHCFHIGAAAAAAAAVD